MEVLHKPVLEDRVAGPVFVPGDAGFEPEVACFNLGIKHTPDYVVAAESTEDVMETIRFARANGLRVTVQGAGHGAHGPVTSGVMISTRRLDHVHVDPATRTVTVGAGVRWGAVIAAAAPYGLFPICGSSQLVGVVGYMLGGGLGPLARSHGVSSDYLAGVTMVTADGQRLDVDSEHHPDLLWALRGGKYGFGIVTEMKVRLVELRTLYAGSLFFEAEHIETVLRGWIEWTATAHARVTTSVAIIRFPPFEFIPAPLRGRCLLSLRFAFPGSAEEGAALAAPLRALAPVYLDMLGEMPVTEVARIHNDPSEPGFARVDGMLLKGVDPEFATALLAQVGAGVQTPLTAVEIRHLGEATHRDVEGGSAAGGRHARYALTYIAADPSTFDVALPAASERMFEALQPWFGSGPHINFIWKPRSAEHYASCWSPETFERLNTIRKRYDPDGFFSIGY